MGRWHILCPVLVGTAQIRASEGPYTPRVCHTAAQPPEDMELIHMEHALPVQIPRAALRRLEGHKQMGGDTAGQLSHGISQTNPYFLHYK